MRIVVIERGGFRAHAFVQLAVILAPRKERNVSRSDCIAQGRIEPLVAQSVANLRFVNHAGELRRSI